MSTTDPALGPRQVTTRSGRPIAFRVTQGGPGLPVILHHGIFSTADHWSSAWRAPTCGATHSAVGSRAAWPVTPQIASAVWWSPAGIPCAGAADEIVSFLRACDTAGC